MPEPQAAARAEQLAAHEARAAAVAAQILARPHGARVTVRKRTASHSIRDPAYKRGAHPVDVSPLENVLSVDPAAMTATVEGQVPMGQLVAATMAHGRLPRVVPEFRDFTVAGLINGEGIQSSSHRHGLFTDTLAEVEVALGDGSVVRASPEQNADLFAALPGSLGTLGVVTAATLRLMPAAPYVRSTYRRYSTLDAYLAAFEQALDRTTYMEGVVYAPDCYVIVAGELVDDPSGLPRHRPDLAGEPYYYQHVRAAAEGRAPSEDVIDTAAYLSRSERGVWWTIETHAGLPPLTETRWGRRAVDRRIAALTGPERFAIEGLTTLERERCLVNQDLSVRLERLGETIRWVQRRLDVRPLWNCAIRMPDEAGRRFGNRYLVDVGIYGEPRVPGYRYVRDMRALQRFVDVPSLWGVSYLTREELRAANVLEMERYEAARRRYHAEDAFLHVEQKVLWVDPNGPDRGPIPFWRLHRTFGPRWFLRARALATLLLLKVSGLAWEAGKRAWRALAPPRS
jgi:FAD/FMN-containing dehydrogenase